MIEKPALRNPIATFVFFLYNSFMAYIQRRDGNYDGLAGIWGYGPLPGINVQTPEGPLALPPRPDYYGYPYGRPYLGRKPSLPLFGVSPYSGPAEPIYREFFFLNRPHIYPRYRSMLPSPAMYEMWDQRLRKTRAAPFWHPTATILN